MVSNVNFFLLFQKLKWCSLLKISYFVFVEVFNVDSGFKKSVSVETLFLEILDCQSVIVFEKN
jgi:hypothetical protein